MPNDGDRDALLQIVERRHKLDGRFTDIRRIGSNGGGGFFSILLAATDNTTGSRVALKFFNPLKRFAPDAGYRFDSFSREERILQHLTGERDIIGWVSPVREFVETFTAAGGDLPPKN